MAGVMDSGPAFVFLQATARDKALIPEPVAHLSYSVQPTISGQGTSDQIHITIVLFHIRDVTGPDLIGSPAIFPLMILGHQSSRACL